MAFLRLLRFTAFATVGPLLLSQTVPALAAEPVPPSSSATSAVTRRVDPNAAVLAAIKSMPEGGSYAVTKAANEKLQAAIRLEPEGLRLRPEVAKPSYCSGATYLVFLRALETMARAGELPLDARTLAALLVKGQRDGQGIWGRWNANGPGTARLFHELGLGRNFTELSEARPGDFLKIFWTKEIGQKERGHSVIYLGTEVVNGVDHLRFWSSNQPGGYGVKSVPQSKIARMVFSRLETPKGVAKAPELSGTDKFLASMLSRRSSMAEVEQMCGM